jgi:hypothetical protein
MPQTAQITINGVGTPGDTIQVSDARGITYKFELAEQEFDRSDETCVSVHIGKTAAATANNLFRKMRPFLAISATINPEDGTMGLVQDHEGAVAPIVVTGDTFVIAQQFGA